MKIAVLGGGITGITVAHLLVNKGHEVHCLEGEARPGGLCSSEEVEGFWVDRAGGHIIFSRDEEVLSFLLGALGEEGHHTSRRQTFIHLKGRLVQYPFENGLADLDPDDRYACLRDYIEANFARRQGAPEPSNFHDWCLWRFGDAICRLFMHPYNKKIWNVDLTELGVSWVSGRVPDAPLEDVVRSALGLRTEGYAHQATFHYPVRGGFEALVRGIAARLPAGVVRSGTRAQEVARKGSGGFLVNGERFDRVVSTVPLQELRKTLELPREAKEAFDALDYVSLVTVFFALDKAELPPHSWLYFPDPEDGPQNRITYLSNYSPKNAPKGASSVMAEVTYYRELGASDEEVGDQVARGLERCGIFSRREIRFVRTFHNRYAYILYRRDLEERLAEVRSYCREFGLDLVGRFGNYNYFNSDMCVRAAMDLAASYPDP